MATIKLIAACSNDDVIADSYGRIPWKINKDLKFFREQTIGKIVVMGRKTFESIGCRCLPKRDNFVITQSLHPSVNSKALFVYDLEELKEEFCYWAKEIEIYIIGGAKIYEQFLDVADEIIITRVDAYFLDKGVILFPKIPKTFKKCKKVETLTKSTKEIPYGSKIERWYCER